MGNPVIVKTPRIGKLLYAPLLEAFAECFPAGVVNILFGDRRVAIPALESGRISVLAFIGSSKAADALRRHHPLPHRLRCVLGLDAKNAGIVLPCADMVFQSYALFPHLTVRENILFGLKVRKVPEADQARRLDNAVEILGLSGLLERKPSALSGGQQQRVALGRALVAEASVCLMDEPLSNLDAKLRLEMRREIRDLQQRLGMLEGASRAYYFRRVVIPLLMSTTLFVLVNATINAFRMVDHLFVLTQGGPNNATSLLLYYIYETSFKFWDTGYAATLTMVLLAFLGLAAFVQFGIIEKRVHYR